jgi:hypothetical protein
VYGQASPVYSPTSPQYAPTWQADRNTAAKKLAQSDQAVSLAKSKASMHQPEKVASKNPYHQPSVATASSSSDHRAVANHRASRVWFDKDCSFCTEGRVCILHHNIPGLRKVPDPPGPEFSNGVSSNLAEETSWDSPSSAWPSPKSVVAKIVKDVEDSHLVRGCLVCRATFSTPVNCDLDCPACGLPIDNNCLDCARNQNHDPWNRFYVHRRAADSLNSVKPTLAHAATRLGLSPTDVYTYNKVDQKLGECIKARSHFMPEYTKAYAVINEFRFSGRGYVEYFTARDTDKVAGSGSRRQGANNFVPIAKLANEYKGWAAEDNGVWDFHGRKVDYDDAYGQNLKSFDEPVDFWPEYAGPEDSAPFSYDNPRTREVKTNENRDEAVRAQAPQEHIEDHDNHCHCTSCSDTRDEFKSRATKAPDKEKPSRWGPDLVTPSMWGAWGALAGSVCDDDYDNEFAGFGVIDGRAVKSESKAEMQSKKKDTAKSWNGSELGADDRSSHNSDVAWNTTAAAWPGLGSDNGSFHNANDAYTAKSKAWNDSDLEADAAWGFGPPWKKGDSEFWAPPSISSNDHPRPSSPKELTVTYWATVECGDRKTHIPIEPENVCGSEKIVINAGMKKVWKWVQKKKLEDKVTLQDAFDLAQEIDGEGDEDKKNDDDKSQHDYHFSISNSMDGDESQHDDHSSIYDPMVKIKRTVIHEEESLYDDDHSTTVPDDSVSRSGRKQVDRKKSQRHHATKVDNNVRSSRSRSQSRSATSIPTSEASRDRWFRRKRVFDSPSVSRSHYSPGPSIVGLLRRLTSNRTRNQSLHEPKAKIECRICSGDHSTAKCPYKDLCE